MSITRILLAATASLSLSVGSVLAQPSANDAATEATMDVLVGAVRSNRKALVAVNLQLTDDEAVKFWPVYDRYQQEVDAVGDRLLAVIKDYTANFRDLSDDKAMKLVEDYLAVEADRVAVRRAFVTEFAGALPGRKVARLYQIENKMDAVLRYDIAATIPVVE